MLRIERYSVLNWVNVFFHLVRNVIEPRFTYSDFPLDIFVFNLHVVFRSQIT